ncbi:MULTISPECIES: NAD(P)H-dependent oxidoreductase [Devosia]|jgi:NAD(P)H dehydrogenase (quinone)|uniref:NAD(P)H-dependent oxidoreductase n=1 Tax=Devosia litorisediminis TaxID=2829817 RepID=A0A942E356_9HYPH|nr:MULTISPECIES: NAD(P)H-dependent oxidoreductase [Devosia]MBS3847085.1 NAD(P)H-dependent oxidoreductase [Devosia litorisediminis]MCZ4346458.1 NAD(P)H-dependent oxidoreductase [Devosia neptuniae]|tara:strand:- start:6532 stop:7122 length:591 start_codon:yes stop_codon:yes gene_type:complete
MRVHVIHAHPVETSFNRALFNAAVDSLAKAGHSVDALNLYDEEFPAVLTREERLGYHEVPDNITPAIAPYVERLRAADALVVVHPVWNYGYPAILKGYFDRVFVPGVSFTMEGGDDRGRLVPCLTNIRKVAFITSYGGNRLRSWVMGDPPRRLAMRWGWATFRSRPRYLALYDMNNCTPTRLEGFIDNVRTEMSAF